MKSQYIISNKWVGIEYFYGITGFSKRKTEIYISAGLIHREKNGKKCSY